MAPCKGLIIRKVLITREIKVESPVTILELFLSTWAPQIILKIIYPPSPPSLSYLLPSPPPKKNLTSPIRAQQWKGKENLSKLGIEQALTIGTLSRGPILNGIHLILIRQQQNGLPILDYHPPLPPRSAPTGTTGIHLPLPDADDSSATDTSAASHRNLRTQLLLLCRE